MLLQAIILAVFAPIAPYPSLIRHNIVLRNFPLASAMADFAKGLVFAFVLLHSGYWYLGMLSMVHLFLLIMRQFTIHGLRLESRDEFFPLLKLRVKSETQGAEELDWKTKLWRHFPVRVRRASQPRQTRE